MPDQPNDLTRKVFRAEIAAVNAHLAETAPSAPADADLRYQVLHALDFAYCNGIGYETPEQLLDAYDAHRPVLPAPADRAAVLREAAGIADQLPTPDCAEMSSLTNAWDCGTYAVATELRRMADETQQAEAEAHPAEHTWAAELYDPVAEEWVPGTRYTARDRAVNHLDHANTIGPTWKDGTPTQRRLVRATTTYTVEQPAN